jgi:hypothetical protein
MAKYNKWLLGMKIKYPDWDAPLLAKKLPAEDLSIAPTIIDDATAEKAKVYNGLSSATAQREYIYLMYRSIQPCTDNDIFRLLGRQIPCSTISARRNELIARGRMTFVSDGQGGKVKRPDLETKEPNVLWKTL